MHSAGLELTKLTHARLEDNLIPHRGDRSVHTKYQVPGTVLDILVLRYIEFRGNLLFASQIDSHRHGCSLTHVGHVGSLFCIVSR